MESMVISEKLKNNSEVNDFIYIYVSMYKDP